MIYLVIFSVYLAIGFGLTLYYYEKTFSFSQRIKIVIFWPAVVYLILRKFRLERHTFNDM